MTTNKNKCNINKINKDKANTFPYGNTFIKEDNNQIDNTTEIEYTITNESSTIDFTIRATTVVTNIPAPTFAPTPISVIPDITEIISEKTSGAPLPKARNVTPCYHKDQ